jgi:serine/threonine protein kinase
MQPRTPGSVVGNYELVEPIGAGGMGEVWKARDQLLNRIVALKFLAPSTDMPASTRDLVHEARAASALNHPNIVTIFQVGESNGVTYLAMEYVEGESLRRHMRETRPVVDEALDISQQIVDGLASAHARGIIHRDLKPENIMVRVDGRVKLVDFGLAKQLLPDGSTTGLPVSEASQSGHLVGTFNYMSPEQARGQPISTASDVFSLGIVMYELLSGRNPFRRDQVLETLNAIVGTQPPALAEACPTAPPGVVDIVSKSLEKDPGSRYSSAVMIGEPLARARREWDQTATQARVAAPRRYAPPVARLVAGVALVALLILTGWSLIPSESVDALGQSVQSVAVLTLRSTDPNAASLAESLPEDLGGALAKAGFQVASRGSVQQMDAANPRLAGVELGVDAVLDGTVRIQGSAVRVYMELINARTGFQLWSGTFTAEGDALISGDPQMAVEVANQVRAAVLVPR